MGEEDDRWLVTQADIAALLGVSRQRVSTWVTRSERNGFPDPVEHYNRGHQQARLWDYTDVLAWWVTYVPNKGGAPRGARNGRSSARA